MLSFPHISPRSAMCGGNSNHVCTAPVGLLRLGAAHASDKRFIPCLSGNLNYRDLQPQAVEYQAVLLQQSDGLLKLVRALADILKLRAGHGLDAIEDLAKRFASGVA